jgi:diguanylate cyclase (GGDEF)-like protein
MHPLAARLKTISAVASGAAILLAVGALALAGSSPNAARLLIVLVMGLALVLARMLVAASGQFVEDLEAHKEEAGRVRSKQMATMQESKELRERWAQMEFFSGVLKAVASLRDVDSLLDAVLERVTDFLGAKSAFVMLLDPEEGDLYVERSLAVDDEEALPKGSRVKWGEGIPGRVAASGKPVLQGAATAGQEDKLSLICVPLRIENQSIGCLMVEQKKAGQFSKVDLELVSLLGQETSLAIERARLYSQMEQMSITDPLTKLSNRRYFDNRLNEELSRAQRNEHSLCVTMLDIDHFKKVNDTYGHAMGDTVLKGVAEIIRREARGTDLPARYGGEEFILVAPETTLDAAQVLAERLRQAVEQTEFAGEGEDETQKLHVTISLGVAAFPDSASDKDSLVKRADQALYGAKEGGRNQVRLAGRAAAGGST